MHSKKRKVTCYKRGNIFFGVLITLPAIFIISFLYIYLLMYSFFISLTDFNLVKDEINFIGLRNYVTTIKSGDFHNSLQVTFTIAFFAVFFEFLFGLLLAVTVNGILKKKELFKTIFLMPIMIAPTVVGLLFRFMLNDEFGILNAVLKDFGLISQNIGWLVDSKLAKLSIIILDIWATTPLVFLLLYTGITGISKELYESGRIDGANGWQLFCKITMPLIKRVSLLVIFIRFMDVFRVFDSIYVLTKGGPGRATESLSMLIYRVNWYSFDVGLASSITYIMTIIMLIIIIIINRLGSDFESTPGGKARVRSGT